MDRNGFSPPDLFGRAPAYKLPATFLPRNFLASFCPTYFTMVLDNGGLRQIYDTLDERPWKQKATKRFVAPPRDHYFLRNVTIPWWKFFFLFFSTEFDGEFFEKEKKKNEIENKIFGSQPFFARRKYINISDLGKLLQECKQKFSRNLIIKKQKTLFIQEK